LITKYPAGKVIFIALCLAVALQAGVVTQTLGGSAGFADGQKPIGVATWNAAVAGHAAPFNAFNGSDVTGPNFNATWAFSYGALGGGLFVTSATIQIGLYDLDSAAAGSQIGSYTEGANNLTALLDTVSEGLNGGAGAANAEYDLLTINLPAATFADLLAGSPSFNLQLASPGLNALGGATAFNGAGIDFATITINTSATPPPVPEPATWGLLLAGAGVLIGVKRFRRA
jgi:hypothetical protein